MTRPDSYCLDFTETILDSDTSANLIDGFKEESLDSSLNLSIKFYGHIFEDGIVPVLDFLKGKQIVYLDIKGHISETSLLALIDALTDNSSDDNSANADNCDDGGDNTIINLCPDSIVINIANISSRNVQLLFEAVCSNKHINHFTPKFVPCMIDYRPSAPPGDEYVDSFIYLLEHWHHDTINIITFHFSDVVLRQFLNCNIQMNKISVRLNNTDTADLFIHAVLSPQHRLSKLNFYVDVDRQYDDVGNNLNSDNYLWNVDYGDESNVYIRVDNSGNDTDYGLGFCDKDTVIDKSYINEYYHNRTVCINNVHIDDDSRIADSTDYGTEVKNLHGNADKCFKETPLLIFQCRPILHRLNCVLNLLNEFKSVTYNCVGVIDEIFVDKLKDVETSLISCGFNSEDVPFTEDSWKPISDLIHCNTNIKSIQFGYGASESSIKNLIGMIIDCENVKEICMTTTNFVPNYDIVCDFIEKNNRPIVKFAAKK